MNLRKFLYNLIHFKEPDPEPGFVLAWDEPRENNPDQDEYPETKKYPADKTPWEGLRFTGDLPKDSEEIMAAFGGPGNQSLGRRELNNGGTTIVIYFLKYAISPRVLARDIMNPLNGLDSYDLNKVTAALSTAWVESTDNLEYALQQLLYGKSIILIQGEKKLIISETGEAAHRPVSQAINERVVQGPQEGFTEDLATNLSLIQKRYRTHHLQIEILEIGTSSQTPCAIISVKDITNPRLLAEVKRRISGIKISHLTDSGMLEQLIEDNTLHPYPQILSTERPDRIAASLDEGKVAVLVDGSHMALSMPVTVYGLIHSMEDYSIRWPYGVYLRLIRILAVFAVLLLPAFYVAVNLYQPELVPTDILLSLVSIKQRSPLPTILEVIILELVFEILREAGFRGPSKMAGPLTVVVGIFLGLLSAITNFINPVLLEIIAITGIATFMIPQFSVSISFRLTRYLYTLLAFIFGFIGIAFGAFIHLHLLARQKSFGVPMLAPIGPITGRTGDVVLMKPVFLRKNRPDFFDPLSRQKQPKDSQTWKTEQEKPQNAPEVSKEREEP